MTDQTLTQLRETFGMLRILPPIEQPRPRGLMIDVSPVLPRQDEGELGDLLEQLLGLLKLLAGEQRQVRRVEPGWQRTDANSIRHRRRGGLQGQVEQCAVHLRIGQVAG